MSNLRRFALVALVAFVAALGGVFAGRALVTRLAPPETELHAILHHQLELDSAQRAQIEVIEQQFAARKRALEREMRSDNARLAAAITAEHGYGPGVQAAVDRSHHVMGELQKETLSHVFRLRAVLRPDQARKFDAAAVKALTAPPA
ncbi:periplasmic heavy metal sensor [Sandarakinorhabdus sp.]|uniref:Spy/CpxP family protein refolding chaperone n=1 Tax=Sandarakinorhabdus sp. TaxID=1916663 RepID=UPI00286DE4A4|nr:periplasmic heavy metal sensor [Sandarakinorhabdus sp.]